MTSSVAATARSSTIPPGNHFHTLHLMETHGETVTKKGLKSPSAQTRLSLPLAAGPRRFQWPPSSARILLCSPNIMDGFINHCKGFASTSTGALSTSTAAGATATSTAAHGATGSDAMAGKKVQQFSVWTGQAPAENKSINGIDLRLKSGCGPLQKWQL